jgi:glucose/arabinose dehydrogenase
VKRSFIRFVLAVSIVQAGCGSDPPAEPLPNGTGSGVSAVQVASGLSMPVYLTAPANDPRLFVVERPGRIRVIENGQLLGTPFLDISSSVVSGGERGLLSVAFHPEYETNGFFYVNYTGLGNATRIERYRVSADANRADPASASLLLTVAQPYSNHNGGLIKFGPDGMLYVGMGDGGSGGDPLGHGQNRATLLGSLLRIDVDGDEPYAIPEDNPFVGDAGARPEAWAIGLRNPWRFSFDPESGHLYIADVGQNRIEEINARPASESGLNYGWNIMEGSSCFRPASGCDRTGLVLPIVEYANPAEGCSVTGGYVYRGVSIPELQGHYFFADFCRGWVRSFLRTEADTVTEHRQWPLGNLGSISSFGEDAARELYVLVHQGRVYRLEGE